MIVSKNTSTVCRGTKSKLKSLKKGCIQDLIQLDMSRFIFQILDMYFELISKYFAMEDK